jgi:hypothetical protein
LKSVHGLFVMVIRQINFFKTNQYFVDWRSIVNDCISHGVLWPLQVLPRRIVDASKSRSHDLSIFNILDGIFHVETPQ